MAKSLRNKVLTYGKEQYGALPDHPFARYPEFQVLRHSDTRKWFCLFGLVDRKKLGIPGDGSVDILNVKCDPVMSVSLRGQKGILPAYHMNHAQWLTILLDGTVPLETVCNLLDISYQLTMPQKKGVKKEKIMVKVYCYDKCSTCKKALKWLDDKKIKYQSIDIKGDHPDEKTLHSLYKKSGLPLKRFFNTSGMLYRDMELSKKLPEMSDDDMLKLLASDGMLVKRPLLITDKTVIPGFKEEAWKDALG